MTEYTLDSPEVKDFLATVPSMKNADDLLAALDKNFGSKTNFNGDLDIYETLREAFEESPHDPYVDVHGDDAFLIMFREDAEFYPLGRAVGFDGWDITDYAEFHWLKGPC